MAQEVTLENHHEYGVYSCCMANDVTVKVRRAQKELETAFLLVEAIIGSTTITGDQIDQRIKRYLEARESVRGIINLKGYDARFNRVIRQQWRMAA